jgi:hypothetical protein
MATAADLEMFDRVGPVLCKLGGDRVNLAWQKVLGEDVYFISGHDAEGRFFSGHGVSPSDAFEAAQRAVCERGAGAFLHD